MICPECNNGILSPSLPVGARISYRGFSKEVATLTYLSCSSCSYESTEPVEAIDMDGLMNDFKREVNRQLSLGEEL